jgi:succinylarginine dihydrolase
MPASWIWTVAASTSTSCTAATPCRVVAAARSNLNHGLHRSLMPDWEVLVLLFSGETRNDIALLERVRDAFHGLPAVPPAAGPRA